MAKVKWSRVDANAPFPPLYVASPEVVVFWEANKWYVSVSGETVKRSNGARRWFHNKESAMALAESLIAERCKRRTR